MALNNFILRSGVRASSRRSTRCSCFPRGRPRTATTRVRFARPATPSRSTRSASRPSSTTRRTRTARRRDAHRHAALARHRPGQGLQLPGRRRGQGPDPSRRHGARNAAGGLPARRHRGPVHRLQDGRRLGGRQRRRLGRFPHRRPHGHGGFQRRLRADRGSVREAQRSRTSRPSAASWPCRRGTTASCARTLASWPTCAPRAG